MVSFQVPFDLFFDGMAGAAPRLKLRIPTFVLKLKEPFLVTTQSIDTARDPETTDIERLSRFWIPVPQSQRLQRSVENPYFLRCVESSCPSEQARRQPLIGTRHLLERFEVESWIPVVRLIACQERKSRIDVVPEALKEDG